MTFAMLPSLRLRDRGSIIRVRVSRKWEFRGGTDDGDIVHVDLVLIDEMGNSMYAEIPADDVAEKSPLLEEGKIYVISRFRVSNAKYMFMPVPENYMIEFSFHTLITPVAENMVSIPELAYHLTPFAQLDQRIGDQSQFTDIIGILVSMSDTRVLHPSGRTNPTITRDITLRDLTHYEIKVTLWGHRASAFSIDAIYDPNESKPLVVLLVGTVVKTFRGQTFLSGNAASRWYFNPDIPEATAFYSSLSDQRIEIAHAAPAVDQTRGPPLAQAQIITLTELSGMNAYDIGANCYRTTIVIDRLVPGERWWFPSCARCNRSCIAEPNGVGYKCKACLTANFKFKYKLAFVATDGTAEAQMVAFAEVGNRIIGKPIHQFMKGGRPVEDLPTSIADVVGTSFTFAVMLTEQSFDKREKSYRVLSVLTSHGRQLPASRLRTTAGTSTTQPRVTSSQQQQIAPTDSILQTSTETNVPTASDAQQLVSQPAQTTSEVVQTTARSSQHTPAASKTIASSKNKTTLSSKKDSTKTTPMESTPITTRRKLVFNDDQTPEETTVSVPAAKKPREQKKTTAVQVEKSGGQTHKSSPTDDTHVIADAASDANLD